MAVTVRNIVDLKADQAVTELKKLRLDLMKIKVGTIFHMDASTAISTADATDLPTVITLANALKASYNAHCASACSSTTGQGAHIAADAANLVSSADATDQSSVNTLLNELKGDYNTHRAATTFHPTADGTNTVSSSNASDLATSLTLANEIKTDLNAHYAAACNHSAISLVDP